MGIIEELASLRASVEALTRSVGRHSRVPEQRWATVTTCTASDLRVTFPGTSGEAIITRSTEAVWVGAQVIVQVQGNDRWIVGLAGATIPAGFIGWHDSVTAPAGWLVRDGSTISRATYWRLFAELGTRHGVGDGSTTFALPNDVGRVPIGAGGAYGLGTQGGAASVSVGDHRHDFKIALMDANYMPTGPNAAMGAAGANYAGAFKDSTGGWSGGTPDGALASATRNPGGTPSTATVSRMVSQGDTALAGAHSVSTVPPYTAYTPIIKF